MLFRSGRPIQAFYHSTCGGRSADVKNVFPRFAGPPYLDHDRCFCEDSPKYRWERTLTIDDLKEALVVDDVREIKVLRRTDRGRVDLLKVSDGRETYLFRGTEFRRLVGYRTVPSTWFDLDGPRGGAVVLRGRGYGHGVGLCQWGARKMAEDGRTFTEIVRFYYPHTRLVDHADE